jgi:hypothetical protein
MPFTHLLRDPNKITGLTLLEKIIVFMNHSPDAAKCDFNEWYPTSPGHDQLKQISILCKIFTPECYDSENIKSIFDKVMYGSFILNRSMDTYNDLFTKMSNKINAGNPHPNDIEWDLFRLRIDFEKLYDFKIKLARITNESGIVMEMSPKYSFAYNLMKKVSRNINLMDINEHLSSIVDPTGRIFNLDQLVKEYDYPVEEKSEDW